MDWMLWLEKVLFSTWLAAISGGVIWFLLSRSREKKPVAQLPPEIRAQLDGCRRCNLSGVVCRQHPAKAFEACGCGGIPAPCPSCRPGWWDLPKLVEENAQLRERLPW